MKRAVAIKYDATHPAPFIVAKERGLLADRLLAIAEEYGIETIRDETLLDSLFFVETGSYIPESLFEAVAAMLAYIYRTRSSV